MTEPATRRGGIEWDYFKRWFLRGRVFRIAIQSRLLTLATIGVLATIGGWWGITKLFDGTNEPRLQILLKSYQSCPWSSKDQYWGGPLDEVVDVFGGSNYEGFGEQPSDAYLDPWSRLSVPFRQFYDATQTVSGAAFLLLCCVWAAAVWGFFGGAITRSVVMQLTREEAISLGAATRHARKKWRSYATAPLFPLIFVAVIAIPAILIGLLMKASLLVGAILWPIALLIGLIATILLAGLSVGWPLMHPAISAEGSDSFDALSRSYSYVYQRPLNYLLYAVAAFLLGAVGLVVVTTFAGVVEQLAFWSVGWGSGVERVTEAMAAAEGTGGDTAWGTKLFWFWHGVIKLIIIGFAFAFFWTASTAIYLLLRYDVDGAELDEVYLDESTEKFGLPTLAKDAAGVPVVPPEGAPETKPPHGSTTPTVDYPPDKPS